MIRTIRTIDELKCETCGIIQLRGEKWQGQRCCDSPRLVYIGEREVPHYEKTVEEEKNEVIEDMSKDDRSHFSKRMQNGGW